MTKCENCGKDLRDPTNSGHLNKYDEWVCGFICEHMQKIYHGDIDA